MAATIPRSASPTQAGAPKKLHGILWLEPTDTDHLVSQTLTSSPPPAARRITSRDGGGVELIDPPKGAMIAERLQIRQVA